MTTLHTEIPCACDETGRLTWHPVQAWFAWGCDRQFIVHRPPHKSWLKNEWTVTHRATGLLLSDEAPTREEACRLAAAVGPLADWSKVTQTRDHAGTSMLAADETRAVLTARFDFHERWLDMRLKQHKRQHEGSET